VPGTDHASIATEAKVVDKLRKEGITKDNLTREQFLEHAWEWTHKHGGIILEQLKKLVLRATGNVPASQWTKIVHRR
jgi:Valyl-tRNA synthetase